MRAVRFALLAALPVFIQCSSSGSSSSSSSSETQALWIAPAALSDLKDDHWYDHPWPSDLRRDPDGSIRFDGFYNPHLIPLLDQYLADAKGLLDGFSPAALGYMRFTGDIDESTLPASPQASLDPSSSVQLLDIDPKSPEHGQRKLLQTFWRKDDGVYWFKDTLAVGPALGYPLRAGTRYAIVVTTKVKAADGKPLLPSDDLRAVLGLSSVSPKTQAAHDLFAPAIAELASAGIAATDIAHFTAFTTTDPTKELFAVADSVNAGFTAPTVDAASWSAKEQTGDYDVYEGNYGPSPNFQKGTIPFKNHGDGGSFAFDSQGKPILQSQFVLRFALVIPNAAKCAMPADGYPIMLYAHGTGGDYRSFINDGTAQAAAQQCVASMGIDQIFHGTRPGAPPADDPNREGDIELLFFNLQNIVAARTNNRQAAIDVVQQARLFTASHQTVPTSVSRTQAEIKLDATKLTFFGHSQGGLNGPLFLAADKQARGGVLSGSGSMITVALLEKTQPQPSVAAAVKTLLGLTQPDDAAELNLFHPVMNIAQAIIDATDPIHYAPFHSRRPRAGFIPKSVYMTEGIAPDGTGDSYAPPHGIELQAVAAGLPRELPGVRPVAEDSYGGIADVSIPTNGLSGDLASGQATGVLAQFVPPPGVDGHFVVFQVPQARLQAAQFIRSLSDDPKGKVTPLSN
jgi:hypothetical protein